MMITQPRDEIKSASEKPLELTPEILANPVEIPANPAETPVTVPIDDPAIVVRSKNDYSNSLSALLKKYEPGNKEKLVKAISNNLILRTCLSNI